VTSVAEREEGRVCGRVYPSGVRKQRTVTLVVLLRPCYELVPAFYRRCPR
jgi:hypothetical protein